MIKKLMFAAALFAPLALLSAPSAQAESHGSSVIATGTFEGRSDHITTGGISILKTASGHVAVLESDFSLDGAPAPTLGFGDGEFVEATEFSELEANTGLQVYAIPEDVDPAQYTEFYVWCRDFSVPLGVASLSN
ncbi:MAG: DM13 domain-containing protein [Geminicoccaceae bacterium]